MQLIMMNQADQHKDEIQHHEVQLAELSQRVRNLEENESLLKVKIEKKKTKIGNVRKDQDEAVVNF